MEINGVLCYHRQVISRKSKIFAEGCLLGCELERIFNFMRMRKKKNLEERLVATSDVLIEPKSENLDYSAENTGDKPLDLEELFGNQNPVVLEIWCGKGQFAVEFARRNPDVNVLAVEKCANVVVMACEKIKAAGVSNVIVMKCGAEYLARFIKPHTISRIFLNFSCPYPKNTYASHRLTAPGFLEIYKKLLKTGAEIHQKTDNAAFFEYSIEQLSNCGFALKNISLDLHKSNFEGNIVTEYEQRFSEQGFPIFRLEAFNKYD